MVMPGISFLATPEETADTFFVRLFCGGVKAVALLARPFLKAMNAFNASRFPSSRSAPSYPFVDDGRYDYGLSQPEHGIVMERGVRIPMRDGTELRGDVFRPDTPGRFPVIMAEAPYPLYIKVQPGVDDNGGVGTRYQQFEQANPEYWVPRGYVYVTINTRGYGGSNQPSAFLDYQEAVDYYDAIEWAASQPWSNGKVGLFGISYYAMSQYFAAALKPPHLAAIVPWEGLLEPYRDIAYRGGILSRFAVMFAFMMQVTADRPWKSKNFMELMLTHPYLDDLWTYGTGILDGRRDTPRIPDDVGLIEAPMLSVGNLNDPDLHLRGNVNAFAGAGSREKKLLLYSGTHWGSAYQPWANRTVLRFFDHYLKGRPTGLEREPAVDVQVRTGPDTFTHVYGNSWPLEQTLWTRYYLNARDGSLVTENPEEESSAEAVWREEKEVGSSYQVTFRTPPLEEDVTVAGPVTAHLWVSTQGRDVDLTVELRDYDPQGRETRFAYVIAGSPDEPVTRGWLRASRRALDPERSRPHQPWHLHKRSDWLTPGVPVEVDVEIWPTGMVFKAGHRIAVTVHCGRYKRKGEAYFRVRPLPFLPAITLRNSMYQAYSSPARGTRVHTGGRFASWLELPVIPPDPSPVHPVLIRDDRFEPETVGGEMGDRFEWTNAGSEYHSVTEASGLGLWDSQIIRGERSHNPETWWVKVPWAGTFSYRDMVCGFQGRVAVPPRVPDRVSAGERVAVTMSVEPPPEGTAFDLQLRKGDGEWQTVREAVAEGRAELDPLEAGEYGVRCRIRSLEDGTKATGWSPPAEFTVR